MSAQEPSKTDVDTILKRLRTLPFNKVWYDRLGAFEFIDKMFSRLYFRDFDELNYIY